MTCKHKIFLLGFLVLISFGTAFADLTTNLTAYYKLNIDTIENAKYNDSVGPFELFKIGSVTNYTTGHIEESASLSGGGYLYADNTNDRILAGSTNFTVGCWFNASGFPSSGASEQIIYIGRSTAYYDHVQGFFSNNGGSEDFHFRTGRESGGTPYCQIKITNGMDAYYDGQNHFMALMRNTTTCNANTHTIWIDGVKIAAAVAASSGTVTLEYMQTLRYGSKTDGTFPYTGKLDGCFVYERELEASEIVELNNSQYEYPFTPPVATPSLSLSTDLSEGQKFNTNFMRFNFSGTPTDTGDIFNCSFYVDNTLNLTKNLLNITETQNFNFTAPPLDVYYSFNVTCSNNNATDDFVRTVYFDTTLPVITVSRLHEGKIYFRNLTARYFNYSVLAQDTYLKTLNITFKNSTGYPITNFWRPNLNVSGYTNYTARNLNEYPLGNYSLKVVVTDDYTNMASITYNVSIHDSFYVIARDIETNTTINEFTATMLNASVNIRQIATTGFAIFNLTTGTYTFKASATNYVNRSITVTPSEGEFYYFSLNISNAFRVYIRDQITNALIEPQIIYLEFLGTNSSNYSTTTGFKYITDLMPDDYIIRYSSANYSDAFHYFTLSNGTNIQFTIYMLPVNDSTSVSLYVYDEDSNAVEGAEIGVYRWSTVLNSYVEIHNLRTDFEGKSMAYLQLNSEFYKFYIYYNDILRLETSGAYITGTELTFTIVLRDPIIQDYYQIQDVDGYVSYNTETRNFRYYYNDQYNHVTRGCLYLYQVTYSSETLYNSSCVSSNSALILLNAQNVSGMTYVAKGYITISGQDYLFGTYSYTFQQDSDYGNFGLIIVIFLELVCGLIMVKDPEIGLILLGLPLIIGSLPFTNWINIPLYYTMGLEVILVVLAVLISKRLR